MSAADNQPFIILIFTALDRGLSPARSNWLKIRNCTTTHKQRVVKVINRRANVARNQIDQIANRRTRALGYINREMFLARL